MRDEGFGKFSGSCCLKGKWIQYCIRFIGRNEYFKENPTY
jgi:hypothetical protein